MKRYLSNRLYFQTRLLSNTVIEIDDKCCIVRLIPMTDCQVEPAHTIFLPGTLVGAPLPPNDTTADYPHGIPALSLDYNQPIDLHIWDGKLLRRVNP